LWPPSAAAPPSLGEDRRARANSLAHFNTRYNKLNGRLQGLSAPANDFRRVAGEPPAALGAEGAQSYSRVRSPLLTASITLNFPCANTLLRFAQ